MFRRKDNEGIGGFSAPANSDGTSDFDYVEDEVREVKHVVTPAAAQPSANTNTTSTYNNSVNNSTKFETVRSVMQETPKPRPAEPMKKTDDRLSTFRTSIERVEPQVPAAAAIRTTKRIMTVGQDTFLKGEISTCDKVIVEGQVDAKMGDVFGLEITETGSFKGSAVVADAEISGTFDGDLSVKGRLLIYSTGRVTGKIRYGEIEIQRGGKVTGEIKSYDDAEVIRSKKVMKTEADEMEPMQKEEFSSTISELFATAN